MQNKGNKIDIKNLDLPLWLYISKFIGFVETSRQFSRVNKIFYNFFKQSYLITSPKVVNGHLIVSSGQPCSLLLDIARYSVYESGLCQITVEAKKKLKGAHDIQNLRTYHMSDLFKLNSTIYSYWEGLGSIGVNIPDYVREMSKINNLGFEEHIERDFKFFKTSRVSFQGTALIGRSDGTILVTENRKHVYLVLGLANSLYEAMGARPGRFIGINVMLTLLPWEGKIIYDGLMAATNGSFSAQAKKDLFKVYARAVERGELIATLKQIPDTTTGKSSQKTKNLTSEQLLQFKLQMKREIDEVKFSVPMPKPFDMWVFRRHGYTLEENPERLVTVLAGSRPLLLGEQLSELLPTAEEILSILVKAMQQGVGRSSQRPTYILVDYDVIIPTLRHLLEDTGVKVEYYPPPTKEELMGMATQPHEYMKGLCAICGKDEGLSAGRPLLQCSRCKKTTYCCKEHQMLHWPTHKMFCSAT